MKTPYWMCVKDTADFLVVEERAGLGLDHVQRVVPVVTMVRQHQLAPAVHLLLTRVQVRLQAETLQYCKVFGDDGMLVLDFYY